MSVLTVLSYGAGQDSTAILYKLLRDVEFREKYAPGELLIIFADTGNEHSETYKYLYYVQGFIDALRLELITFVQLKPQDWATGDWKEGLISFYEKGNRVGSKAFPKTCTDNLKIRPIYRFLEDYIHDKYKTKKHGRKQAIREFAEQYGKIRVLIGIAKGEEKRIKGDTGIKWMDECVERIYPLIELGWDRASCQKYISITNNPIPVPSNCILCPFMDERELLYLVRGRKEWFLKWVELEKSKIIAARKAGQPEDKNLGVWGKDSLLTVLARAEAKYGHMTIDELEQHRFSHGHCTTSKY